MEARTCLTVADGQTTSSPLADSGVGTSNVTDMAPVLSEGTATQYQSATVSLEAKRQNTNIYNGFQMFVQETLA